MERKEVNSPTAIVCSTMHQPREAYIGGLLKVDRVGRGKVEIFYMHHFLPLLVSAFQPVSCLVGNSATIKTNYPSYPHNQSRNRTSEYVE